MSGKNVTILCSWYFFHDLNWKLDKSQGQSSPLHNLPRGKRNLTSGLDVPSWSLQWVSETVSGTCCEFRVHRARKRRRWNNCIIVDIWSPWLGRRGTNNLIVADGCWWMLMDADGSHNYLFSKHRFREKTSDYWNHIQWNPDRNCRILS